MMFGAGKRRLRDFASAIRPELRELPVPRATEPLLDRIRASRSAGTRTILPTDDPSPRRHLVWYMSAVVAAAAVVFALSSLRRADRVAVADIEAPGSWFGGAMAFAQSAGGNPTPPARVTVANRVRPMSVAYERVVRDSAGRVRTRNTIQLRVDRKDTSGTSLWRVASVERDVAKPGWSRTDTIDIAASDLRMVRARADEAPYRGYSHIGVTRRLDGMRLRGTMRAERNGTLSAERHFDRVLSMEAAPYVPDAFAPLFFMGVALDAEWKGRVSILGWAVRDDDVFVPVAMRVIGDETLRLPAGEFSCWRLAIEYPGRRIDYWVRKSDGLGVRSLDSTPGPGRAERENRLIAVR